MTPATLHPWKAALVLGLISFTAITANAADKYADIHTIGIISGFSDTLTLKKIGTMVFSNSQTSVSIADWDINTAVVNSATTILSSRFSVKPVTGSPAAPADELRDFRNWKQKPFVSASENSDIDAYAVILPDSENDPLGSSQEIEGLGFLNHARMFGNPKLALYAIYRVYMIDAKTGTRIDYGSAQVPDSAFLSSSSPYAPMTESQWVETEAQLSPSQKTELKDQLTDLIKRSLPYAFRNADISLR